MADREFERIVFSEVLIPYVPNAHGDFMTRKEVREFAYAFMKAGIGSLVGIDLDHDNKDVSNSIKVVESFIARPNDPDFKEGSWVVGVWINNDDIWQQILDGELNGFSYEAIVSFINAELELPDIRVVTGYTEPDPFDGHKHKYFGVIDITGKVKYGATEVVHGHYHDLDKHSITKESGNPKHKHRVRLHT